MRLDHPELMLSGCGPCSSMILSAVGDAYVHVSITSCVRQGQRMGGKAARPRYCSHTHPPTATEEGKLVAIPLRSKHW